jgi:Xaa-Pro dipeptidase
VVVDFVGNVGGYLIDQTRIMTIGDLDDDLVESFEQAKTISDAVISASVPGTLWSDLWDLSNQKAEELGVLDRFMGPSGEQVRFVGHGIGLEVDEYPFLAPRLERPLEPGMVFALEPKIFHPGRAITGIEDTYLVTDDGLERLTVTEREIIRV